MTFTRAYATDAIQDKTGVLTVKHAAVVATVGTNRTIVTGVSGKRIRVIGGHLSVAGTAATIQFINTSGGAGITAPINLPANSTPLQLGLNVLGWVETLASGDGLFADVTGATVNVSLRYIEVTYP